MDPTDYFVEPVTTVLALCREEFGDKVVSFYEGDPVEIAAASLPAIIVEKLESNVGVGPTGLDKVEDIISVRLLLNKNDDIGADDTKDLTERKLRLLIEARDKTTGQYLPGTLQHALRYNLTLKGMAFNTSSRTAYDTIPRQGMVDTSEGQVVLTTEYYVQTLQRN